MAIAKFAVYEKATGEILRAGRCILGQEYLQSTSSDEIVLDDATISSSILATAYEHVSDATHYVDLTNITFIPSRRTMTPTFSRLVVLANGVQTVDCTDLPGPNVGPTSFAAWVDINVVGPGVNTTVRTTTSSAAFTFDTPGDYTLTFTSYPKWLTKTQAIIASSYAVMPSVAATGAAGAISGAGSSFSAPVIGLAATGAVGTVWAAGASFSVAVTSASATGSAQVTSKALSKTPTGVSSTGSVGTMARKIEKTPDGVSASGMAADAYSGMTAPVVSVNGTGAALSPAAAFTMAAPALSATATIGVAVATISPTPSSLAATGQVGVLGLSISADVESATAQAVATGLDANVPVISASATGQINTATVVIAITSSGVSAEGAANSGL